MFADVDPVTMNVTADTIAAVLSDRTKAIIVTHLFGNPCQMDDILALAAERGIPVIEDAAQAYLAQSRGRSGRHHGRRRLLLAQQGKHITSGEGGFVTTNDAALARRMRMFVNKAWPYGESNPDHEFLALNYRITELQSAVLLAQLPKLASHVRTRIDNADAPVEAAAGRGRSRRARAPPRRRPRVLALRAAGRSRRHPRRPGGAGQRAEVLRHRRRAAVRRTSRRSAARSSPTRSRSAPAAGRSRWPVPRPSTTTPSASPARSAGSTQVLVFPWNEKMTGEHMDFLATSVLEAVQSLVAK